MLHTKIDGTGWDYDWFAVDMHGYLIHLASGGGTLPESVASSAENLAILKQFFYTLPELSTSEEIALTAAAEGDQSSFLYFARRGLYSFDKMQVNNSDPFYHLIARPFHTIMANDLPLDIKTLMLPTYLSFSVADLPFIDVTTIK